MWYVAAPNQAAALELQLVSAAQLYSMQALFVCRVCGFVKTCRGCGCGSCVSYVSSTVQGNRVRALFLGLRLLT